MTDNQVTSRTPRQPDDIVMDEADALLPNAAGELLDLLEEDKVNAVSCEMDEDKENQPSTGAAEALAVLQRNIETLDIESGDVRLPKPPQAPKLDFTKIFTPFGRTNLKRFGIDENIVSPKSAETKPVVPSSLHASPRDTNDLASMARRGDGEPTKVPRTLPGPATPGELLSGDFARVPGLAPQAAHARAGNSNVKATSGPPLPGDTTAGSPHPRAAVGNPEPVSRPEIPNQTGHPYPNGNDNPRPTERLAGSPRLPQPDDPAGYQGYVPELPVDPFHGLRFVTLETFNRPSGPSGGFGRYRGYRSPSNIPRYSYDNGSAYSTGNTGNFGQAQSGGYAGIHAPPSIAIPGNSYANGSSHSVWYPSGYTSNPSSAFQPLAVPQYPQPNRSAYSPGNTANYHSVQSGSLGMFQHATDVRLSNATFGYPYGSGNAHPAGYSPSGQSAVAQVPSATEYSFGNGNGRLVRYGSSNQFGTFQGPAIPPFNSTGYSHNASVPTAGYPGFSSPNQLAGFHGPVAPNPLSYTYGNASAPRARYSARFGYNQPVARPSNAIGYPYGNGSVRTPGYGSGQRDSFERFHEFVFGIRSNGVENFNGSGRPTAESASGNGSGRVVGELTDIP